jgi:hypothetical protein
MSLIQIIPFYLILSLASKESASQEQAGGPQLCRTGIEKLTKARDAEVKSLKSPKKKRPFIGNTEKNAGIIAGVVGIASFAGDWAAPGGEIHDSYPDGTAFSYRIGSSIADSLKNVSYWPYIITKESLLEFPYRLGKGFSNGLLHNEDSFANSHGYSFEAVLEDNFSRLDEQIKYYLKFDAQSESTTKQP